MQFSIAKSRKHITSIGLNKPPYIEVMTLKEVYPGYVQQVEWSAGFLIPQTALYK